MPDRSHGYYTSVGYSAHFHREIAPDWLDFCIRARGFEARRAGRPYRYLDLGSGPGFHLCVLAAANPQAEFVGIDCQTEHIAQAKDLAAVAGLTNVKFIQGDFLDLAVTWETELGAFDYIAVYGILSWVSPELRAAVLQCVAHASKPGTVAAFAYNSPPRWLGSVPFQHVAHHLAKSGDGDAALGRAITMFRRLIDAKAPVAEQFIRHFEVLAAQPTSYLAHEFLTDHWTPLWHSTVAQELHSADFTYVGPATIAEALLPGGLPPELRALITEQADESFGQDVQDIVINQQFRRDIFCRKPKHNRRDGADDETPVFLTSAPREGAPVHFKTTFGGYTVDYAVVADIVTALADGPKSFAELVALKGSVPRHNRTILLLMLDAHMLMVGPAVPGSAEIAQRFNGVVARAAAEGKLYQHLAAGSLASGVPAIELDLLLLDTWLSANSSIDQAALSEGLTERLERLGRGLTFQGAPVAGDQLHSRTEHIAKVFVDEVLPRWRGIGVLQ